MREFSIQRSNDIPLNFTGKVIAFASTNSSKNHSKKLRWTELTLYLSATGKFISESVGVSTVPNEMNITKAEVFDRVEDALHFFRNSEGQFTWASNKILQQTVKKFPNVINTFGQSV